MHREVTVESGDLQRTTRLERGGSEEKAARVLELGAGFDQNAQRRRVDELHLAEVDHHSLRRFGTRIREGGAHTLGVVEVELTSEHDHAGRADGLHSEHRILAQTVATLSPLGQTPSSFA